MLLWKELLRLAYIEAMKSSDPSTQNGALIAHIPNVTIPTDRMIYHKVYASDHNRFPVGVMSTPAHWADRRVKYKRVHHAERTVLGTARRLHKLEHLDGFTLICPWAACSSCAQEIIAEGIRRLVVHKQAHDRGLLAEERALAAGETRRMAWAEDIREANLMLSEAGIEIVTFDGEVGAPPVLHGGELWNP